MITDRIHFASLLALGALVLGLGLDRTARAEGNGRLELSALEIGRVGFAKAAHYSASGSGSLALTGIPAGASVRRAWLYASAWGGVSISAASFAGHALAPSRIGSAPGGAPDRATTAYRAEVTGFVGGDGAYGYGLSVTGGSGGTGGVALLVVYDDPALASDYAVAVSDGCHAGALADVVECPWPAPVGFSGFTVDGSQPPEARVAFLVNWGASGSFEQLLFNGAVVAQPDPANDVVVFPDYDVSSLVAAGDATASAACCEISDALDISACVLRVRTVAATFQNYCTAGTSIVTGCTAVMFGSGTPSASAGSGCVIGAHGTEGAQTGLVFYGIAGPRVRPMYQGYYGVFCVRQPLQRTPPAASSGTANACDGTVALDWNAYRSSHPDALGSPFVSGETIWAQCWYRQVTTKGAGEPAISDALRFVLQP